MKSSSDTMQVYWGSGSPVSWRVLLALAIKRIDYQSIRLNLSEKEFRSPEYLALNPRGTFPMVVCGSVCVRGSLAILNFLERKSPDPPLLGTTAESCAAVWQLIGDHEDHLGPAAETLTRAYFRNNGDRSPETLAPALQVMTHELSLLEQSIGPNWLVGHTPTAADIVLYPTCHRLMRAAATPDATLLREAVDPQLSQYPLLRGWLARMGALPGVEDTFPPHWR